MYNSWIASIYGSRVWNVNIVTPAGRKKYLEILFNHLNKQKNDFDIWTLWLNTTNKEDIDYCKGLESQNEWIKTIDLEVPYNSSRSIYSFFKYACDINTIYIRLDDDIVWMEKNFIKNLSLFRLNNPDYFLVYPNIINNAIIDHINQRFGSLNIEDILSYNSFDPNGWLNEKISQKKHEYFIKHIYDMNTNKFKFGKWILNRYERVSINCISWFGEEFEKFYGKVEEDEEQWLSVIKPKEIEKYNIIYGEAICVHFAFYTQRHYLDKSTNILDLYKEISLL